MDASWFTRYGAVKPGNPAAVKCGTCSWEISVKSIREHGMTREKGKIESRTEKLLYKDHKRKTAGCKHVFLQLSHLGFSKEKVQGCW